jgi:hypothetical protein
MLGLLLYSEVPEKLLVICNYRSFFTFHAHLILLPTVFSAELSLPGARAVVCVCVCVRGSACHDCGVTSSSSIWFVTNMSVIFVR